MKTSSFSARSVKHISVPGLETAGEHEHRESHKNWSNGRSINFYSRLLHLLIAQHIDGGQGIAGRHRRKRVSPSLLLHPIWLERRVRGAHLLSQELVLCRGIAVEVGILGAGGLSACASHSSTGNARWFAANCAGKHGQPSADSCLKQNIPSLESIRAVKNHVS